MLRGRMKKRILLAVAAVLVIAAAAAGLYLFDSAGPTPEALAFNAQYDQFKSTADGHIHWHPASPSGTGLIFYQGGKVQAQAYGPLLLPLLDHGVDVFLPEMPFNLAVFDANAAAEIIEAHPEISTWWLGGHSLGGAMAADFVYENPELVDALILLAAYPQESKPLNDYSGEVLAFFGTRDGLVSVKEISKWEALLPLHTRVVMVEGGNHAQFGSYGDQKDDLKALISSENQQQFVRDAWLTLMASESTLVFEGVIASVEGNRFLVETIGSNLFEVAWVDLMPEAEILDSEGRALSQAALTAGAEVEVTILPAIRESYPVQVSAVKVVIQ
ncbi:alpha/beta hydrolase [Acidaminobacter hydrogenoformans]|uniref:Alpha/beta hydrolase family protein n=1 Tax=Acidaminobacter hydrogenoformans DSM 2784 TaxID=1120920 RepID=A0A1G5RV09_9FIRM|nr:alpha/beta hydrolase [Acidaminobacter hydrogenoformans]SCZ77856.1 Alpha/beta hydrolase family protein [Acidaminobacter hydrogenoformans DSM 2784]